MNDIKTKVVSMRLSFEAINVVDDLVERIKKIRKKKGDYSRTQKQDIVNECILLGASVFEKELENK